MFSELLNFDSIDASKIFDFLYDEIFYPDFIENKTYLANKIKIDPQSYKKDEGKEHTFWHLTTRIHKYTIKNGNRYETITERLIDYDRAKRLHWVKIIIENHSINNIKLFYKKESKGKKPIRLYLWLYEKDFVVILQKLGRSSSFLVTSFYITHNAKRDDFQKYYEDYINSKDPDLKGCEWF